MAFGRYFTISGVGVALSAGASEGLLFDSLKTLGRDKEHIRISGKVFIITNIAMAIVFVTGAYMFVLNPKLPAYVSLPFIIVQQVY